MSQSRVFFSTFAFVISVWHGAGFLTTFGHFELKLIALEMSTKKGIEFWNKKFFLLYISIHTYNLYNFVFWWCIMAIWRKQIKRTYKLYLVKNPFSPILSEIVVTKLNCDGPLNGVLIRNMALLPLNSFRNSKVIILIYVQENFMRNNWDKISLFFFRHLFLKKCKSAAIRIQRVVCFGG